MKFLFSFCVLLQVLLPLSQASEVAERDLGDTIWSALKGATTCAGCDVVIGLLKLIAAFGDKPFVDTIAGLCIAAKADDADVCKGALGLEGPILANRLRQLDIPSHTSKLFCITFLGLCDYPAITPYTPVGLTPNPTFTRPLSSGQDPIQVVHFSDIHIDPFYQTGANYNCTKPICCRPYTAADSPGQTKFPAGPYGNTNCDAPASLEDSMYAAIRQIAPDAALTIFTGDIVDHAIWLTSKDQNIKDINDAYTRMSGLPRVYGTAGNHEASPTNAFPPNSMTSQLAGMKWVYDTLTSAWTQWIGVQAAREVDIIGAYSVLHPGTKLRIISLNTNFYYKENYWLYQQNMEKDPSGQLAWLVNELQAAENAGERVYLVGHMPMGLPDAFRDGSNYFDQIVNRYSATIAAQFFGHTHSDEFEISYSDYTTRSYSTALSTSFICPSMTPTSGHPAFRVYSIDPITFGVLDIETYIANISSPTYQTSGPKWERYYSATEAYGSLLSPPISANSELTPAFWHNLTVAFENNDAAFQEYVNRKSRGLKESSCTGACKSSEICQIRAARSQDNCGTITPGIHFRKRGDNEVERSEGVVEVGECEGSALRQILAKLASKHGLLEDAVEKLRRKAKV